MNKIHLMKDLRTRKTYQKYMKFKAKGNLADGCNLCNETKSIKEFKYWRIINNIFPWDRIAKINHMIVSKRHATHKELNTAEKKELEAVKYGYIEKNYEIIVDVVNRNKTIPGHFHTHLITLKH